jgi:hypothetical protein
MVNQNAAGRIGWDCKNCRQKMNDSLEPFRNAGRISKTRMRCGRCDGSNVQVLPERPMEEVRQAPAALRSGGQDDETDESSITARAARAGFCRWADGG